MGLFDFASKHIGLPSAIKRFGHKIANSKALRFGDKIAGGVKRIGHKISHVAGKISHGADMVGRVTGKVASFTSGIPVVGSVAGIVNKGVMGVGAVAKGVGAVGSAMERAGSSAQGVIRVGRSLGDMRTGADLVSGMRDLARASSEMGGATSNLVSQARSVGTTLQRRR